ncbi:MAG: hypothetical protein II617_03330, partial [Firmicutes bacterium]|nr:hypothetical protein [Bacillota bacterium]
GLRFAGEGFHQVLFGLGPCVFVCHFVSSFSFLAVDVYLLYCINIHGVVSIGGRTAAFPRPKEPADSPKMCPDPAFLPVSLELAALSGIMDERMESVILAVFLRF